MEDFNDVSKRYRDQQDRVKKIINTPEYIEKNKSVFDLLQNKLDESLPTLRLYGRIIDQFENGVPDASIDYVGTSTYFSQASGGGKTTTDSRGNFIIRDVRGGGLVINSPIKPGYQFSGSSRLSGSIIGNNNPKDPYIINAWKVDRYPRIKKGSSFQGFKIDGRIYTVDFLGESKIKKEGDSDGDLQIRINRTDSEWNLIISAINGGVQEAKDEYHNLAPKNGYVTTVTYSGKSAPEPIFKNIYFQTRNSEIYGFMRFEIIPYYREISVINFDYIVNLEKGRNLTIKQE